MSSHAQKHPVALSVGVFADDDAPLLRPALESLFRQSVFARLGARHAQCEVLVITRADAAASATARAACAAVTQGSARLEACALRVIEMAAWSRAEAWNRFVHEFSAVEARFLCFMEPEIAFHHRETLFNLMAVLERRPHVPASTDRQVSALILKERPTLAERFQLAHWSLARAGRGRLGEQLYCLRAGVARSIFLPRDLAGAEVDFIGELVRTEFLTRDASPRRVAQPVDAAHLGAARGEKPLLERYRQRALGRVALHVLLQHVQSLSWHDRLHLGETLRRAEARDPDWLKKLIAAHLRRRPFFWPLSPGLLTLRFRQLGALPGVKKLTHLPAACAGAFLTLVAGAGVRRLWCGPGQPVTQPHQAGELAPASRSRAV